MLKTQIRDDIEKALKQLTIDDKQLTVDSKQLTIEIARTSDPKFGDFTTNIALKLKSVVKGQKSIVKQSPLDFANKLSDSLGNLPYVEKLEVAAPGFINFFIKPSVWQLEVEKVLKEAKKFGSNSLGKEKKARVEFVSANPTGPLHFGNARGGPIGDCLASVLAFSGYTVIREYYHNDVGEQIRKLGESIVNVQKGAKLEDQEYKGEYVADLAKRLDYIDDPKKAGDLAVHILFHEIVEEDSKNIGINFDRTYSESYFSKPPVGTKDKSLTQEAVEELTKKGFTKENDGALWFAPNDEFLKDRECVLRKSDGSFTYFANDVAYHKLKFADPEFHPLDLVIDVFGANHHGHVPRLQAVIKALGHNVASFHVILYQWVRFKRGGELIKMSKRSGTFVTAREVLEEVGKDALRFFILMHDANSHIDFDLELAKDKSQKNPVYYVQYAHARICSILKKLEITNKKTKTKYELLSTDYELDLIKQISRLPDIVEDVSKSFAVHRLCTYSTELADSFHRFYENCKVMGEKKDLMQARLDLTKATKIALENTLNLLGVSAPEKM